MHIFVDSNSVKEILHWKNMGVVDGVLIHNYLQHHTYPNYIDFIQELGNHFITNIHINIHQPETEAILSQARKVHAMNPSTVIQVPLTPEGIKACQILSSEEIQVNVTLCFTLSQAVVAHKAKAHYITTCITSLTKAHENVEALILDMLKFCAQNSLSLIVGGIRSVNDVELLISLGVQMMTIPPHILQEMFWSDLTDQNLEIILNQQAITQRAS